MRLVEGTYGTTSSTITFTLERFQKEKKEKGADNIFEAIVAENFSNLQKEIDIQVQESQRVQNKMNSKRPRHIIIKMAKIKDKERILKVAREKQLVMDKGTPIRLSAGFSAETLQARRE